MYDWNTHITSTLPHVIYEHNCLPTRVWMKRLLFLHEAHWQRLICSVWSRTNTKDSFITLSSFLLIFLFWALLCSHFCPGSSCFSSRPAEFQSLFFLIKAGVGMCFGGQSRTHETPNKIADSAESHSILRVDIVLQSRPAPNTGSQVFQLLPGGGSTPGRRVERGVESADNKRW